MNSNEQYVMEYLGFGNLRLNRSYCIEKHILDGKIWEPHVVELFRYFVRKGFTCVDVGANTGIHSICLASCVGETGKVFAFEPSPEYAARLQENIALNPNFSERIKLYRCGISDKPGVLKLFESGELSGNAYLADEYNPNLWNRFDKDVFINCPVTTLDLALGEVQVDLIKIDVEGMEAKVLSGSYSIVQKYKPFLIYETLIQEFGSEKVIAMDILVRQLDYHTFFFNSQVSKLTYCTYPNFAEDVIAIHPARMLMAAPAIHNCVRYLFLDGDSEDIFSSKVNFTAIMLQWTSFAVAWSAPGDESREMIIAITNREGQISFSQDWNGETITTTGTLIQHYEPGRFTEMPTISLTITKNGVSKTLTANKLGGGLYSHAPR